MIRKDNKCVLRIMVLISGQKLGERATEMFDEEDIPIHYHLHGRGTAPSEIMDILGLGSSDKSILVCVLTKTRADEMLIKLRRELKIGTTNSGIVFTLPLTGVSSFVMRMAAHSAEENSGEEGKDGKTMSERKYSIVAVIVDQGYSEEVMEVARKAGAGGGTVINSRAIADETAMDVWNINFQEEKEIVVIAAANDTKLEIMQAITEKFGINSDAKGITLALPIDNIIGLSDY
ncbi:MAG: hypothetical protein IJF27_07900 [Oscillospiraceae bacterium]|nr:hypothetical protein [Oscillospiraceae bacterium]MBQ3049630.1 hypothetical protein [Oscillospiraceae bacterium]MBQ9938965.1 hypothetical protein [Oscillospiraceae bacterium]